MFDPNKAKEKVANKSAKAQSCARISQWASALLPEELRDGRGGLRVMVDEVVCGDPTCSPIDTVIQFWFDNGIQKSTGIPKESKDVVQLDVTESFPDHETFLAWGRGENVEWPPADPPPDEPLRFAIGERVRCCVGKNTWAPGVIIKAWYREPEWPPDAYAPYQVSASRPLPMVCLTLWFAGGVHHSACNPFPSILR